MTAKLLVPPGTKFSQLTVMAEGPSRLFGVANPQRLRMFECRCDCGRTRVVALSRLRAGRVTNCGHEPEPVRTGGRSDEY